MKTSSSKPAISTSPDNHCSLHNINYCLKIYQSVWLEYFTSFYKIICNSTNNWYFYKNLRLHLSEAIVFVQKPHLHTNQWENSIFVHFKQPQVIRSFLYTYILIKGNSSQVTYFNDCF